MNSTGKTHSDVSNVSPNFQNKFITQPHAFDGKNIVLT